MSSDEQMKPDGKRGNRNLALGFVMGIAFTVTLLGVSGCVCGAAGLFALSRYVDETVSQRTDALVDVGSPAPDFTVESMDGAALSLDDFRGTPVLVSFWASWCPPCVAEIPVLDKVTDRHGDDEIVVLAINAGESPAEVRDFLSVYDVGVTFALDPDGDVSRAFGAASLPTAILIDADGVVAATHAGMMSVDAMEAFIKE